MFVEKAYLAVTVVEHPLTVAVSGVASLLEVALEVVKGFAFLLALEAPALGHPTND
ncbi:MAG: hypothetical protein Q7R79_02315 [bacterium]|nr:hypothetical protein [bacterium]